MTDQTPETPGSAAVLLATDLSPRSDRAEGRAMKIAEVLGAGLHVVAVIESSPDCCPVAAADANSMRIEAELCDLYGAGVKVSAAVEAGEAWSIIIREAVTHRSPLIVLGPARPDGLQEKLLGSTAERVIHNAPAPVLTVRRRAARPYSRILVATDFSATARHALKAAAELFPGAEFHLVHAYRVPFTGFLSVDANSPDLKQEADGEMQALLSSLDGEPVLQRRLRPHVLYGSPDEVIGAFVVEHDIEVVVMGAHGTGSAFDKILGGTAERLLGHLPCDVLLSRLT